MILISRSIGRKMAATTTVAAAFVGLFTATAMDSKYVDRLVFQQLEADELIPGTPSAARLKFTATAYCKGTTTASGVNVRTGIAAADPTLLPVGSVIQIDRLGERYNGIYTIMDTGPSVQGRHIDIYMWSCNEALSLGHRDIVLNVLRLGWNPQASTPTLVDRLFRRREAERGLSAPLPSRPIDIR
ncbi:MAG: 3D domain-containing protein [Vicinamibacterales bacterium]